ncbi:hypothetical protein DFH09DRAFT_1087437 [Mycena vulgaris]|nr:hypothetical protein DFH09DRAFT_1087437 [Mycena vulgaris]
MPRRAVPAIQTPTRHRSFRRPWTRMPPPPPRTSPAPACRETREGGESGDGGRRSARCRAAAAAPSTFPFAATLIAYADRHDEASLRTPDTHGHAFVSQRARARTYMKGTQDAEHDAALPHSCADDGALGGGAGAGSRAGTGTGRTRVPGGTSGGERVPRAARRRRRCGGDASSAARGASALPAIHRALRLRMGGCRSVPTTAHARGDAPAPSVEECAFELDADAAQLVVDGASPSPSSATPLPHRDTLSSSSSPIHPPPSLINRGRGLLGRRVGGGGGCGADGETRVCFAARKLGETARARRGALRADVDAGRRWSGGCDSAAFPRSCDEYTLDAPRTPTALSRPRRRSRGTGNAGRGRARATGVMMGGAACGPRYLAGGGRRARKTRRRARQMRALQHYPMGSPRTRLARRTARRELCAQEAARASWGAGCLFDGARGAVRGRALAGAARGCIPAGRGTCSKLRPQPDAYAALDSRRLLAPTHGREREAGDDAAASGASRCWVYWEVGRAHWGVRALMGDAIHIHDEASSWVPQIDPMYPFHGLLLLRPPPSLLHPSCRRSRSNTTPSKAARHVDSFVTHSRTRCAEDSVDVRQERAGGDRVRRGAGIGVASSLTWSGRERERVRHWEEQAQVPRERGGRDGGGPHRARWRRTGFVSAHVGEARVCLEGRGEAGELGGKASAPGNRKARRVRLRRELRGEEVGAAG